jgi:hypothetical protein
MLLVRPVFQERVVCVPLGLVECVESVAVILGPGRILCNALRQVGIGDEVATCSSSSNSSSGIVKQPGRLEKMRKFERDEWSLKHVFQLPLEHHVAQRQPRWSPCSAGLPGCECVVPAVLARPY